MFLVYDRYEYYDEDSNWYYGYIYLFENFFYIIYLFLFMLYLVVVLNEGVVY